MREDVQNEHSLGPVIDPRDQPVIIAMDIKHRPSTHNIRMREIALNLGQRAPVRSLGDPIPVHQRDQRIAVLFGEPKNGRLADPPHNASLQNGNLWVKRHECRFYPERSLETRLSGEPQNSH